MGFMTDFGPLPGDVRMRGFARRSTVAETLAWLDGQARRLPEETVPLAQSAGRVLARDATSPVDVPHFVRAMMDGYAVRAADTLGASPYNRLALDVVGESLPGRPFVGRVGSGQAVRIMTGAPLPGGADAVLPAELTEPATEPGRALAVGEVSPEKHLGRIGEDIAAGAAVLLAGRVLRPQDVGVLSSIGMARVPVIHRPRVRIVVTGDELLAAGSLPRADACKIPDANGPMLVALVARDGGLPQHPGIVPDRPEAILDAMRTEADVVLVSGGSSVGAEDHAPALLARHGRLAIHGIAMRPSSPTGMGVLEGRLVFLLPGNPVSCLAAYDFFAGRAIRVLGGRSPDWPYRRVRAPLARKVASMVGRLDYLRVRLVEGRVEPLSIGGASLLSSTSRADGFVLIPPDSEGYPPGAEVEVYLYDV
jgi:molybdopterin molybdotransferase